MKIAAQNVGLDLTGNSDYSKITENQDTRIYEIGLDLVGDFNSYRLIESQGVKITINDDKNIKQNNNTNRYIKTKFSEFNK